jgi:hypothetical protein
VALAIRSSNTADGSSTFTKPTGLANGDVLYLMFNAFGDNLVQDNSVKPSAPSGFTEIYCKIRGQGDGTGHPRACVTCYRKVITNAAGEPANYTVGAPGSGYGTSAYQGGIIYAVSGADTTTPEADSAGVSGNSATADTGSIIDSSGTDWLLFVNCTNMVTLTPGTPSGMTNDFNGDTGDARVYSQTTTGSALSSAQRTSAMGSADSWVIGFVVVKPAAGGTTTPKSVAGAITPAGTLVKAVAKRLGGGSTPAGTLSKRVTKTLTGALTPAGTVSKRATKTLGGSVTPTGALTTSTKYGKTLAGAVTPAGALVKQTGKVTAGGVTPSGVLSRAITKNGLAGAVTPAGALVKQTAKTLVGGITPSGSLTFSALFSKALGGTVTPAGALVRQVAKNLAGGETPTGTLSKAVTAHLGGTVTPTGALTKVTARLLGGAVSPSGVLLRLVTKTLAGALTPSSTITKQTASHLGGGVTPTGSLTTQSGTTVTLGGSVVPTGTLGIVVLKSVGGTMTPHGTVSKLTAHAVSGSLTPSGTLGSSALAQVNVGGSITPTGTLIVTPLVTNLVSVGGTVTPQGTLLQRVTKRLAGVLHPTGTLTAVKISGVVPTTVVVEAAVRAQVPIVVDVHPEVSISSTVDAA